MQMERKMTFPALPTDLQNLVVQFAYKITLVELQKDLFVINEMNSWNLDPRFINPRIWCDRVWGLVPNPLEIYRPLSLFRSNFLLFNMALVDRVLGKLDFRRKGVRYMGSRWDWLDYLQNWEFMGLFAVFYRDIKKNPRNLKPIWTGMPLLF